MLAFEYISNENALASLVAQYEQAPLLVLDTEFVRTRTYYAKLGLIQAYDGKTLALIDPVAIKDLSPFWALLTNKNIIKLLHSCSEHLEVFAPGLRSGFDLEWSPTRFLRRRIYTPP